VQVVDRQAQALWGKPMATESVTENIPPYYLQLADANKVRVKR